MATLVILLAFALIVFASGQDQCTIYNSNLAAEVLLLDYNSLWYRGNHPGMGGSCKSAVCSPEECCDLCKNTPGCNSWTYCNNFDGCGSDCSQYVDSTERFYWPEDLGFVNYQPELVTEDILPIIGMGPYVQECTSDDKWPREMCSLKIVDLDAYQELLVDSDEWVSGIVLPSSGSCTSDDCIACQASVSTDEEKQQCIECTASAKCNACYKSAGNIKDCTMCKAIYE
eukprot:TRINITY_DN4440_c0_g1_i1.p2 TRINITY_DN4440_c0_g1~~TRINITY_DN4440_c0_g1_i1.p2  ORF type:complete len:228 (-),score=21.15 TRINITY_DN4440_c0_g1_i1:314-997(-)